MQTIHSHLPALIIAGTLAVVLIMWWVPKFQARYSEGVNAENRFDRENNARKTLAQIIGGVFVLAGLYSSVKTFDLQRQSARLQEEGQITDRFSKAIDQLGAVSGSGVDRNGKPSINLEMRLGGIYALERIASDSPRDYWTIMEVLMTYVRENSPASERAPSGRTEQGKETRGKDTRANPENKVGGSDAAAETPHPRTDIQAILTVIGRRDFKLDPPNRHLDLSYADLAGASLKEVDLESTLLIKSNLDWTDFMDANLKGADLQDASLEGASLVGTNLQAAVLRGADLKGADLSGADLSGAIVSDDQLSNALGDTDTKLPPAIHRPASWSH